MYDTTNRGDVCGRYARSVKEGTGRFLDGPLCRAKVACPPVEYQWEVNSRTIPFAATKYIATSRTSMVFFSLVRTVSILLIYRMA
jgi:hypothetical protein